MIELIFASNNPHKVEEMQTALDDQLSIISLMQAGINISMAEPHNSLEDNALEKALTIHRLTGKNCFSEDTGLEVEALQGEPGVRSARYAGEGKTSDENIDKLLTTLGNNRHRNARFRAIICLILEGRKYLFEGICEGTITAWPRGENGFGYDPVFVPTGSNMTLAEMNMKEKQEYSHRKKAGDKLVLFLQQGFTPGS